MTMDTRKSNSTTVKLKNDTWEMLINKKAKHRFKTFDDAIKYLLLKEIKNESRRDI